MADESYLHFDSSQRTGGTNNAPRFKMDKRYRNISSLVIDNVQIPFTYYVVNSNNNKLDINQGGEVNITITAGNYTAAGLASTVQAAINASTLDNFTVTYDSSTYRFTFTDTDVVAFDFLWDTGTNADETIGELLGFDTSADSASATTHTSDNATIVTGDPTILVKSRIITSHMINKPYYNNARSDILFSVPVDVNPGSVILWQPRFGQKLCFGDKTSFDEFDFALVDKNGNEVDLNGAAWTLSFYSM
jgi:hypothetical protein